MCIFKVWRNAVYGLLLVVSMLSDAHALPTSDHRLYEHADIEAQLDQYLLRYSRGDAALSQLEDIISQLKPTSPILTRTRARGYYALETFGVQADEASWQLALSVLEEAEKSGVIDAIVDARSVVVSLHYYAADSQEALVEL